MPEPTDTPAAPMDLLQKLAAVRREISVIPKRGENTYDNYRYAMASDMAGLLGNALAAQNVLVARRNLQISRSVVPTAKGGEQAMVEITCDYGFIDADSKQELWQPAYGEGRDRGDKASYKAFTGALKYFLVQAFMLATGDDPEVDSPDETKGAVAGRGSSDRGEGAGAAGKPRNDDSKTLTDEQTDAMVKLLTFAVAAKHPVDKWLKAWGLGAVDGLEQIGRGNDQIDLALYAEVKKLGQASGKSIFEKAKARQPETAKMEWPDADPRNPEEPNQ